MILVIANTECLLGPSNCSELSTCINSALLLKTFEGGYYYVLPAQWQHFSNASYTFQPRIYTFMHVYTKVTWLHDRVGMWTEAVWLHAIPTSWRFWQHFANSKWQSPGRIMCTLAFYLWVRGVWVDWESHSQPREGRNQKLVSFFFLIFYNCLPF